MQKFFQQLSDAQQCINGFLTEQFHQRQAYQGALLEAMQYGVLLGGKRVRPFLVYAVGNMLNAKQEALNYAAAAIECIHAYSLIHDDLPAMDNDKLRRGQPTCHIKFDEATAILAGDALQTLGFELLTDCPFLSPTQQVLLIQQLAQGSGLKGMCLGQSLDLSAEHKNISLAQLEYIHRHKTGALITSAVLMGLYCSYHHADEQLKQQLIRYSQAIGLAFQVQDDILDIEGESTQLGKQVGSDLMADKSTYPKLLGLTGAKQKREELYQQALKSLQPISFNTLLLQQLATFIVERNR